MIVSNHGSAVQGRGDDTDVLPRKASGKQIWWSQKAWKMPEKAVKTGFYSQLLWQEQCSEGKQRTKVFFFFKFCFLSKLFTGKKKCVRN